MKLFRYFGATLILFAILVLQSCGNSNTDTAGTLTIGTPTVTAFSCGLQTVSATITYTPPTLETGAVPNGVQIAISETQNGVLIQRLPVTLGDSFTYNYVTNPPITQIIGTPITVVISASIGSMNAAPVVTVIPPATLKNYSGCSGSV